MEPLPCRVRSQLQESKMLRANCSNSAWAGQGTKNSSNFSEQGNRLQQNHPLLSPQSSKASKAATERRQAGVCWQQTPNKWACPLTACCLLLVTKRLGGFNDVAANMGKSELVTHNGALVVRRPWDSTGGGSMGRLLL